MQKEQWKKCVYLDIEVSDQGRVRVPGYTMKVNGKEIEIPEKFLKPHVYNNYLYVNVNNKTYAIHRLVAELFVVKKDARCNIVRHRSQNTFQNQATNLYWTTRSEMFAHTHTQGEFKRSKGKSKSVYCITNDTQYDSVLDAVKQLTELYDADLNYDTVTRNLRKSGEYTKGEIQLSYITEESL